MRDSKPYVKSSLLACALALMVGAAARAQVVDEGYVAISGATRVDLLDPSTNTFTASIGGTGSRNLSLSSDGRQLFSVTFNAVQVVDTQTNTVIASVPTGNIVTAVAQAANGFLYSCDNGSGTVSVIDPATYTVVSTLTSFCQTLRATPDGSAIWVTGNLLQPPTFPPIISIIDPTTNTIASTFIIGHARNGPASLAFSPDGTLAYLANDDNTVSVLDTATHAEVADIPVGRLPFYIALSSDGAFAYVANLLGNSVSVIDTATDTTVATVPVGSFPRALALTANDASVYVTNFNSGTISVIDTASLTVTATFAASPLPWGIVFQQDSDHDGVPNNLDNCPNTPAGETVDANGCSISQLCPCAGPFGTTEAWNNHGQYVSCVAQTSDSFVASGLITEAQKDALTSAAGQSSCGKK